MKILSLARQRGSRFLMTLDDGRECLLDRRTVEESPYQVDGEIDEEELSELLAQSERRRTRDYALYLLGLRDYGEAELRRKLRDKGYRDTADETVDYLRELGLLNDAVYARRMARDCRLRRLFSRYRTVQELCAHGIARETAAFAVDDVDAEAELVEWQQALALLRKKRYNTPDDPAMRQRGDQLLLRYGYSRDAARAAWQALEDAALYGEDEEQSL